MTDAKEDLNSVNRNFGQGLVSDRDVIETAQELGRGIREFAKQLAELLHVRIDKILDALNLARLAEIMDMKIENGEIIGLRIKLPSESKPNVYYYTMVGIYGSKCTCEANTLRKKLCKHIIAALMLWNIITLFRTGKQLDLSKIKWLQEYAESKRSEGSIRGNSQDI